VNWVVHFVERGIGERGGQSRSRLRRRRLETLWLGSGDWVIWWVGGGCVDVYYYRQLGIVRNRI
jgi:hypothetical protein